jgi:hypothetical protein
MKPTAIFTLWNTPVMVSPMVLGNLVVLWGGLSWIGGRWHPDRTWWMCLLVGGLSMITLLIADFGHAFAHILSARHAGAPMDEVLLSAGMPRTLYSDNEVPPSVHRMRALGGPVFSAAGLLLSLILLTLTPGGGLANELATWSSIGHGFIFVGILIPLPIVDGGTMLKWTLVERGRTPSQADEFIRRLNLVIGSSASIAGVLLLAGQQWLYGLIAVGVGLIVIGAGLGVIK